MSLTLYRQVPKSYCGDTPCGELVPVQATLGPLPAPKEDKSLPPLGPPGKRFSQGEIHDMVVFGMVQHPAGPGTLAGIENIALSLTGRTVTSHIDELIRRLIRGG